MRKIKSDYELLKDHILPGNGLIVDIGCGTGELVRWVASQGLKAVGLDVEKMIIKALNVPKVNDETYIAGIAERLPFGDEFAEVITFIASFHHVPEVKMNKALEECFRVLKPGGKVVLIEPVTEKGSYYELVRLVEDEASIQQHAYSILKKSEKAGLTFAHEEAFYLERSLDDFIDLLNLFVEPESEREKLTKEAKKITRRFCEDSGMHIKEFRYKSVARIIILEKGGN